MPQPKIYQFKFDRALYHQLRRVVAVALEACQCNKDPSQDSIPCGSPWTKGATLWTENQQHVRHILCLPVCKELPPSTNMACSGARLAGVDGG